MIENHSGQRGGDIGPADEYRTLREELTISRKYVFERPLLILALVAASSRIIEVEYAALLLVVVAALLLFNFWFTTNRLTSGARITAYIQVELEERKYGRWLGWETCLRQYRRWLKDGREQKEKEITDALDKNAIPDALMYYPPIYMLHMGLMTMTLIAAVLLAVRQQNCLSIAGAVLVSGIGVWFVIYLYQSFPSRMRALIERNRVIWIKVFEEMQANHLK
jgi:hypothetical protein